MVGGRSIWSDLQGEAFRQDYIDAGGIKTRFLQAGDPSAPALLFLHGTGGHAEAYVRNLAAHSKRFNTFAIDMLGHGFTDKPDYDYELPRYVEHIGHFLDAVGVRRASISGESLGGWVASHFAVAHPDRVDRLVLNTAGGDRINPDGLAKVRETTLATVREPSFDRIKARLEWLMYDKSLVHDDLVLARQRIYSQACMNDAIAHVLSMHTADARQRYALSSEQWASIRAPTLVLWTTHDPTAGVEVGQKLASLIPGARLVIMQNCGHWPQYEDPDTFNQLHLEFLLGR